MGQHFNQVIKIDIISKLRMNLLVLHCDVLKRAQHYLRNVPSKMHNLNLIVRKHQTNANWEIVYNITGLYSSRNLNVTKVKERLWKCLRLKKSGDRFKLYSLHDLARILYGNQSYMGHYWHNCINWSQTVGYNKILYYC